MPAQSLPPTARRYDRAQRRETRAALAAVAEQWQRIGLDFDAGWALVGPQIVGITTTAQSRVAREAQAYVPAVLEDTGQTKAITPAARTTPAPLAGVAGDGRPVDSLLHQAIVYAKSGVADGLTAHQALKRSQDWMDTVVGTVLSDTARQSETLEIGVRPVGGYVRMLTPPSCSRCVVLAGKFYRKNAGFQRHPGCFPAGAVVSGPAPEAATRRWYEGELAIIRTAAGEKLTATGNHPVLTDRGWVPAGLLQEGDRVVRSVAPEGAVPLVIPDEQQAPARIEDVWGADGMVPLGQVPTSPKDFHGDGGHGEVDVVLPDRLLGDRFESSSRQRVEEELLAAGFDTAPGFAMPSPGLELVHRQAYSTDRLVSSSRLGLALSEGHSLGAVPASSGSIADLDAVLDEALAERLTAHAEALAEAEFALAGFVGAHDCGVFKVESVPRWDAPPGPLTMESRVAYASRGKDLAHRLAGQVELDGVVEVERVEWSGHVYNLTSSEGWYCADGLIVSNCDCRHIPVSEGVGGDMLLDPKAYFDSLPAAEQDQVFTKAGAEAIRNGADVSKVVNARRGMSRSQSGRLVRDQYGVYSTTEGTAAAARAARRAGRPAPVRLMPESIAELAHTKDEYLRLLRANGYLL